MSARPISEILGPILAKAQAMAEFQALLGNCPTAECRKELIVAAYQNGAIEWPDAQLLVEAYGLETA